MACYIIIHHWFPGYSYVCECPLTASFSLQNTMTRLVHRVFSRFCFPISVYTLGIFVLVILVGIVNKIGQRESVGG